MRSMGSGGPPRVEVGTSACAAAPPYISSPMPKSDAHFFVQSLAALFKSSASDTSFPELSRVTLLPPNVSV